MPRSVQAELLSNLSLMLRAGVSLTTALEEAAESTETLDIAGDFNDMITSIQGGETFSEAANKYRHIFPKTVVYLKRIMSI